MVKDGAIEFYGTGLDTPYTDTNVYWLYAGTRPGKRIQKVQGGHAAGHTDKLSLYGRTQRTEYLLCGLAEW